MANLENALDLVRFALVLVLAAVVAREPVPDRTHAAAGLRRAAAALWLRIATAAAVALLTLISVTGRGTGAIGAFKLAAMGGLVLNVVALILFALGALRAASARAADLPSLPLVGAGALSVFVAGVNVVQLPTLYQVLYDTSSYSADIDRKLVEAFSVAGPLIAAASIVLVATAIGALARRRGLVELLGQVAGKTLGFVVLMLASVGIQSGLVPDAKTIQQLAIMVLAAGIAGLWATALMAKLCGQGAAALDEEPGLPPAKIV